MCPCSKNHPLNTNSPVHYTNSTFIVSTIVSQQLVQIVFTGLLFGHYKGLPSMNITFTCALFFHFHRTLFSWSCRSLHELRKIFSVHSFVCPITHSSLDGCQPNLVQYFPHVCSTCHTVFSLKNTLKCVRETMAQWSTIV